MGLLHDTGYNWQCLYNLSGNLFSIGLVSATHHFITNVKIDLHHTRIARQQKQLELLDSMRWFSHRRSRAPEDRSRQSRTQATANVHCRHPVTPGGHTMDSSAAACSVRSTEHASPYHALSIGMTEHFFRFSVPVTLVFDLDVRTRARFLYSAPNRQVSSSYVSPFGSYRAGKKQTDKQTDAGENIHLAPLCYAGG